MSILSWFSPILRVIDNVVDKAVVDKNKRLELKSGLKKQILAHTEKIIDAQKEIILAEAKGGWMQRNWRPILMLSLVAILINNYILFPYLASVTDAVKVLEFPAGFWALINLGIGGYVGARTVEKIKSK